MLSEHQGQPTAEKLMGTTKAHAKVLYQFDQETGSLLDISQPEPRVILSGKPAGVLLYLIGTKGKVVSAHEIRDNIWQQTIVSDGSVKDYIAQIRSALHDCASSPTYIETVRGRGYRFLGGISYTRQACESTRLKPVIAVIPPFFSGKQPHPQQVAGEVIAANVIDALSASPLLNVISRLSSCRFNDGRTDVSSIGAALSADYVLSGIFHLQNQQLLLTIELTSVNTLTVEFSASLRAPVKDWITADSAHLQQLVQSIANEIVRHQIELASTESIDSLDIHTLVINAITCLHSSAQGVFNRAELLLNRVVKELPDNASALSLLAQWHLMRMNRSEGWNLNSSQTFRDSAFRYAERALTKNPLHAHANTIMGSLEARLNNNFDKALEHHNTASQTDPNNALNHCFKASACTYQEHTVSRDNAIIHAAHAIRLSPLDPQLYLYKTVAAAANHYAGKLEKAHRFAIDSYEMNPNHTSNLRTLISILVDMDKKDKASRYTDKLMRLNPSFTVDAYRRHGPGIQSHFGQHIATNLETAGVPTH